MNKIFFLLNLIIISMASSHFTMCEVNSSEMAIISHSDKPEKSICINKPSKEVYSWKKFLSTNAGFGLFIFTMFVGTNLVNEWIEGRKLTFIEKELEMINLSLTCLLVIALSDNNCHSSADRNTQDHSKTQAEPISSVS